MSEVPRHPGAESRFYRARRADGESKYQIERWRRTDDLVRASTPKPSAISRFLKLERIGADGPITQRILIKLREELGKGAPPADPTI